MRVSFALLPLLGAAYAIPIQHQPSTDVAKAEYVLYFSVLSIASRNLSHDADRSALCRFLGLPDLGDIFSGGLDLGSILGGLDLGDVFGGLDIGDIFGGGLPKLDVSDIVTQLNTTLGGSLPPIPAEVLDKIQDLLDQISGGAQLTGDRTINANFKASEFGPFEGLDIPPWLLDLVQKLIEFLTGLSGGGIPPIGLPTGIPTGLPTDLPIPVCPYGSLSM